MKKAIIVSLICLAGIILGVVFGNRVYNYFVPEKEPNSFQGKLQEILSGKELKVVLDLNTINYFIYKGEPRGFQYEILKEFCADNNLKLTITATNDLSHALKGLTNGEFDLIAKNVIADNSTSSLIDFTKPFQNSKIVLVQREDSLIQSLINTRIKAVLIKMRSGLIGKKVYVTSNSSTFYNLLKLNNDLGNSITLVNDSSLNCEQLIGLVASGKIDFTVCDEVTGAILQEYYPNLNFSTPITFDQKYSWVVQKKSPEWKRFLDNWIEGFKQTNRYQEILTRYYSARSNELFPEKEYNSFVGGRLSKYDEIIKEVSGIFEFDWRLITSIIIKESRFDADVESYSGASGLMQLMPVTAHLFNVFNTSEPRENIRGGVAYLSWLDELFLPIIPEEKERIKFVLAAYNAGIGHIMDARKLAMKYNYDPSKWEGNVEYFLLKESDPEYYNDPVVQHGFCRGSESLNFVNKVLDRYSHYVNIIPTESNKSLAALLIQR